MDSQGWISVKERLPENPGTYPVLSDAGEWYRCRFDGARFVELVGITHWTTIPPLPVPEDSPLVKELKAFAMQAETCGDRLRSVGIKEATAIVRRHESEARK